MNKPKPPHPLHDRAAYEADHKTMMATASPHPMMQCPDCGTKAAAKRCPKCGSPMRAMAPMAKAKATNNGNDDEHDYRY